jgi:hypothetical protein
MWTLSKVKRTISQVQRFVRGNSFLYVEWDNWYVGVTNDLDRRLAAHRRRHGKHFRVLSHWELREAAQAAAVEKHFLDKGMQGAGGGWTHNSVHVYVFKISGPYA